jgi:hypothetical protein
MTYFAKASRALGVFVGAFYLIGSLIDYMEPLWLVVSITTGVLFLLPWNRLTTAAIWWPAFLLLCAVVLTLVVGQTNSLLNGRTENIFWILVELLQPVTIAMMKRRPEPAGGAYVAPEAGAPSAHP